MNKIAAAYIRVSTDDQVEYSPEAQLVEIRKYAAKSGFIVPASFIFVDEGISGKKTEKRDGFQRMIGVAKQKPRPFDAILLWKFSRFARNREDSVVYKSMLRKQLGIEVISVSEPVGDDKMSILIEALIEAMDEYYSINLAEEVKRGMTEKAKRGGLQAAPSFGYTVENNILIPDAEEAALVREIFTRFAAGEGLFPIAKWLNAIGVKTHRGGRFENRTIEYILRNPVYIGKLRWNPSGRTRRNFADENIILAEAKHIPIISEKLWAATQSRMAMVKAQWKYKGRPSTDHKDWLSGLLRCCDCGCTLVRAQPSSWRCNGYAKGACKSSQFTKDEAVKSMLLSVLDRDALTSLDLSYVLVESAAGKLDEASYLQAQIDAIKKKQLRLREAYLNGVESLEVYSQAKETMEAQSEEIAKRLHVLGSKDNTKQINKRLKENIRSCIQLLNDPDVSKDEKYRAIHDIADRCVYSKRENTLLIIYRVHQ